MALITCPECGKQISDQAEACPNCGYPLKKQTVSVASHGNGLQKITLNTKTVPPSKKIECIKLVCEANNMGLAKAKQLVESGDVAAVIRENIEPDKAQKIVKSFLDLGAYACAFNMGEADPTYGAGKIVCPKCGSTEIHAGARGFSLMTGFIGSGKTVITCLRCGYKWKPGR